uniref:Uncharacterized protein n=1 Tax=Rhizophora mucronata TaxID=61149 RepID=A0A2P2PGJ6_RHIMU
MLSLRHDVFEPMFPLVTAGTIHGCRILFTKHLKGTRPLVEKMSILYNENQVI